MVRPGLMRLAVRHASGRRAAAGVAACAAAIAFAAACPAWSNEAPSLSTDPALEARVMAIAQELRCLVCQNQTIADSHADLAVDLRNQIRLKLQQGQSGAEIRDFMVQRYGDFVLYRPPMKATTWLLWLGPFALLAVAALALVVHLRQRRARSAALTLTPADAQRARELLDPGPSPR